MRRRARIWRLPVLLLVVMLATLAPVSAPVTAAGPGTMEWTGSRWEDPVCGVRYLGSCCLIEAVAIALFIVVGLWAGWSVLTW